MLLKTDDSFTKVVFHPNLIFSDVQFLFSDNEFSKCKGGQYMTKAHVQMKISYRHFVDVCIYFAEIRHIVRLRKVQKSNATNKASSPTRQYGKSSNFLH